MFKDLLESRDLTCYQLAKSSGVSYTAINEIYRGERNIQDCSVLTASKIAKALGLSLDEFCHQCEKREAIPKDLYPCFWDSDPDSLDLVKNKTYIITRLLDKGGYDGLCFVNEAYSYEEIKSVAMKSRNFSPKVASFLKNIFKLKPEQMVYYSFGVRDWRKI